MKKSTIIAIVGMLPLLGCQSLSSRNSSIKPVDCLRSLQGIFQKSEATAAYAMVSESTYADRGVVLVLSTSAEGLENPIVYHSTTYALCHRSFEIKNPFERGISELRKTLGLSKTLGPRLSSGHLDGLTFRFYHWRKSEANGMVETLKMIEMNNPHDIDTVEAKSYSDLVDAFYHTVEETNMD